MYLAKRDQKIYQLKEELENRKKMLCLKRNQLKNNLKENIFLREVVEDYDSYNKSIVNEKEKQIAFLKMLHSYIDNISDELNLTDQKLKHSKQEQREILKEISFLKDEIDDLVENNQPDINYSDNIYD
jgi:DNA repair exonuclease SbcCD ATPase subunit